MPETKPVIKAMLVDDEGRLWVAREVPQGGPPFYDVFTRDGDYEGSLTLDFQPYPSLPIRVRHGQIYALELDEMDIPFVIRAPVPENLRH